jgi:hypothetical protein
LIAEEAFSELEDLVYGECRQILGIPSNAAFIEQLRQRRTAGEAPFAASQGQIDGSPRLTGRIGNRSRIVRGPATGSLEIGLRPLVDLQFRQSRYISWTSHSAVDEGQPCQGRAARQSTIALRQGIVHARPGVIAGTPDVTVVVMRPAAFLPVKLIGAVEDLSDR